MMIYQRITKKNCRVTSNWRVFYCEKLKQNSQFGGDYRHISQDRIIYTDPLPT